MIASLGGAEVDAKGNLNYPGSGGMVGGLSQPGGNWAYWNGAGKQYHRFTPNYTGDLPSGLRNIENVDTGGGDNPTIEFPPIGGDTIGGGGGGTVTGTGTGTGVSTSPSTSANPSGTVVNCLWGNCDSPTVIPSVTSASDFLNSIRDFLAPAPPTKVSTPPVLFSFIPQSNSTGFNMKNVIILAVVAVVAYFAWKKFA